MSRWNLTSGRLQKGKEEEDVRTVDFTRVVRAGGTLSFYATDGFSGSLSEDDFQRLDLQEGEIAPWVEIYVDDTSKVLCGRAMHIYKWGDNNITVQMSCGREYRFKGCSFQKMEEVKEKMRGGKDINVERPTEHVWIIDDPEELAAIKDKLAFVKVEPAKPNNFDLLLHFTAKLTSVQPLSLYEECLRRGVEIKLNSILSELEGEVKNSLMQFLVKETKKKEPGIELVNVSCGTCKSSFYTATYKGGFYDMRCRRTDVPSHVGLDKGDGGRLVSSKCSGCLHWEGDDWKTPEGLTMEDLGKKKAPRTRGKNESCRTCYHFHWTPNLIVDGVCEVKPVEKFKLVSKYCWCKRWESSK